MFGKTILTVENLYKSYGAVKAVDNVSFQVEQGEIFGMVGPNGSGKTTTIECIEGMRKPDKGTIRLLGLDPQRESYEIRQRSGIQLQSAGLPPRMRVIEAMDLFSSFYRKTTQWSVLLDELGLVDKKRSYFSQLSGGQKQRLFVALALINEPEIVFLDELTTGLDPHARRATWDLVRQIRDRGTTVYLTTHFMDEAQELCDRVAILDQGRIIALDTPDGLIDQLGMGNRIIFHLNGKKQPGIPTQSVHQWDHVLASIGALDGIQRVEKLEDKVIIYGQGDGIVSAVIHEMESNRMPFHDLHTERPDLEDVFLALTGREL